MASNAEHRPNIALLTIMLIAAAHGLLYALALPLWQTPDEPMLFEYAALTAELGRVPQSADRSPALEAAILQAMEHEGFWRYLNGETPEPRPTTFSEAARSFHMPRQVGGDPPIYFALAALPLTLTTDWDLIAQARLLRALNALLLPFCALCAYLIAEELDAPALAALGAAALVALQPMYVFVGVGVSNDGPSNVVSAVLCLLIVRALRRKLPIREVVLICVLALIAVQIKRTTIPLAIFSAALGLIVALRTLGGALAERRPERAQVRLAGRLVIAASLGVGALGAAWLAAQIGWGQADSWYDGKSFTPAVRAATPEGYRLVLEAEQEATQVLPDVATVYLRNGLVRFSARVWSQGQGAVRVIIDTGNGANEQRFRFGEVADLQMSAPIAGTARIVRLRIIAEEGPVSVGRITMNGVGLNGDLIANGDLARPALRIDSPLLQLKRYLRGSELLWMLESERFSWRLDWGAWSRWLFDSYWGHFGWMQIAVVRASPWEPLIGFVCAGGLVGALVALARGSLARLPLAALLALISCAPLLLAVNALVDPYPIQQGRYLFPLLPGVAAAIAAGWVTLVPARHQTPWLLAWLSFWLGLSAAALLTLGATYSLSAV